MRGKRNSEAAPAIVATAEKTNESETSKFRRAIALGASALVLTGGVVATSVAVEKSPTIAVAQADEQVFVGGNGDPRSEFIRSEYERLGMVNPNARHVNLHYPASMFPLGEVRTDESIRIGADNLMAEMHNNAPGEHMFVECFSLGSAVCDEFGQRLTNGGQHPIPENIHIITNGDGYSGIGLPDHPIAPLARIVTDPLGIPPGGELGPAPGTVVRFDARDWFATAGADPNAWDIGAQIGMLASLGTNHRIPHANEPHQTVVLNGVTYEIYGDGADPITQAIRNAGGRVPAIGEAFFRILTSPATPQQLAESIKPIERVQDNPANFNPVRNVPKVTPEQFVASPPPPEPAPLPVPEAMAVPPPPVPGQPMTPEQLAFAEQLRSAVSGVK